MMSGWCHLTALRDKGQVERRGQDGRKGTGWAKGTGYTFGVIHGEEKKSAADADELEGAHNKNNLSLRGQVQLEAPSTCPEATFVCKTMETAWVF